MKNKKQSTKKMKLIDLEQDLWQMGFIKQNIYYYKDKGKVYLNYDDMFFEFEQEIKHLENYIDNYNNKGKK